MLGEGHLRRAVESYVEHDHLELAELRIVYGRPPRVA